MSHGAAQEVSVAPVARNGRSGATAGLLVMALALVAFALWPWVANLDLDLDAWYHVAALRTFLVDRDLDLFPEFHPFNRLAFAVPAAHLAAPYLGTFLWQTPALVMGLGASIPGPWAPDAINPLCLAFVGLASLMASLMALVGLVRIAMREGVAPGPAVALVGAFLLAGPLPWYAMGSPGHSHPWSILWATVLVGLWRSGQLGPLSGGILVGALVLTRPQDGLYGLILIACWRHWSSSLLTSALWVGLGMAVMLAPQMALSWVREGALFVDHYGAKGDTFAFWPQHLFSALFSARHGWLTTHPVMVLGLVGLAGLARSRREGRVALAVVLATCWLVGSYIYWHTGSGFGNRYFMSLTPLLTMGLAHLWCRASRAGRLALIVVLVGAVLGNGCLMVVHRAGVVSWYGPVTPVRAVIEVLHRPALVGDAATLVGTRASTPRAMLGPVRWTLRAYPALAGSLAVIILALMRTPAQGGLIVLICGMFAVTGLGLVLAARARPDGPGTPVPVADPHPRSDQGPWIRALVDQGEGRMLDRTFPLSIWTPRAALASEGLDVVTDLLDLTGITTGDEVARVTVRDVHGREHEYGLHANIGTGDGSALSSDLLEGRLPGLLVRAATYSLDGRAVARPVTVATFRRSWSFDRPADVEEVRVRYMASSGRLRLHGLWLWKERPRTGH